MRVFIFLLTIISIVLCGCSSPKIEFAKYERTVREESKNRFLKDFEATDSVFSIIIFTSAFREDLIKVENDNKIIFNDTITSDQSLGLAKVIRINNTLNVKITDVSLGYSFKLKKKNNIAYKYIYIQRKRYEGNKYIITYSNDMRPFY